ncbi:helix-turn-helix domain-containing protein [Ktedonosporobacter rubrisoli]|nr:AraC family transcriptional regulator [Ktedonosporobacter rubrisoli]
MCPADGRWTLHVAKTHKVVHMSIGGPTTKAVPLTHFEGVEWLAIKFKLGVFLRGLSARTLLDEEASLSPASKSYFWLGGSRWQFPDYENADTFVDWLARAQVLLYDPIVSAVVEDRPSKMPIRTLRYRFLRSTGLSISNIRQIERARYATALLQEGMTILDVVEQAGYADQAHLTRSLKRIMGQTPALMRAMSKPESVPHPYAALLAD